MAYTAPSITASGLTIPLYDDILQDLISLAKSIYGDDIYLENDSMDYQLLSIIALKMADMCNTAQMVYNNRSPATAIGSGLDGLIKLNGLQRKSASYSTCEVELTGTYSYTINGGIVEDVAGYKWSLPSPLVFPQSGILTVTATCQTIGAITATVGQIQKISTPTQGWLTVNNTVAAIPGVAQETDSTLRSRQAISTALPSKSLLDGTIGGIASVPNVTRYRVYENDTDVTDSNGIPSHSICAVVEGGTDLNIANEIFYRKNGGCGTYGDVVINMTESLYNTITPIKFFRPIYVPLYMTINIHPLNGYVADNSTEIKNSVVAYLQELTIGDSLIISSVWGTILNIMNSLVTPVFSLKSVLAGTTQGNQTQSDIDITFKSVFTIDVNNVVVNLV